VPAHAQLAAQGVEAAAGKALGDDVCFHGLPGQVSFSGWVWSSPPVFSRFPGFFNRFPRRGQGRGAVMAASVLSHGPLTGNMP
jgi:hypothetical protein